MVNAKTGKRTDRTHPVVWHRGLRALSPVDRFDRMWRPTVSGCHEWIGARDPQGRPVFSYGSLTCLAHRFAWEVANGHIEPRHVILRSCDNPDCVNVAHMRSIPFAEMMSERHRLGLVRSVRSVSRATL